MSAPSASDPGVIPVVQVMLAAATRGVDFRVRGDSIVARPLRLMTEAELDVLRAARDVEPIIARALAWRVVAMRLQVPAAPAAVPALRARPDVQGGPDRCLSCAEPLITIDIVRPYQRCGLCALAAWIALADYPVKVVA